MDILSNRILEMTPSATVELAGKIADLKAQGVDILSFSVGEPDFPTPKNIIEAAKVAMDQGFTKYTAAAGIMELREAVCDKFKKDNGLEYAPNQIIVTTGAKQAIYNALMAICNPGDEVIIPTPCWVSYVEMVKLTGAVPVLVEAYGEDGFIPKLENLKAAVSDKTKAILFNSPNNPTGAVNDAETLKGIGQLALENDFWLVSDEIYEALVYDGAEHFSVAALCPEVKDNCIIINGVSKSYSMTGWRIGYAAGPAKTIKGMSSLQGHSTSNATSIAQKAAVEALRGPQESVGIMHDEFARRRKVMIDRLNAMPGIECADVKGAFYTFPKVSALYGKSAGKWTIKDSSDLAAYLLEEAHIAVVPGVAYEAPEYLRLTYASSMEEIVEGMDRMERCINALK